MAANNLGAVITNIQNNLQQATATHFHAHHLFRLRRKRNALQCNREINPFRDDSEGTSSSWRQQPPSTQADLIREAIKDLQSLQDRMQSLDPTTEDVISMKTAGISNLIANLAPIRIFTEQNPSGQDHLSNLPPELLELILSLVSIKDILSTQQVSRHLWKSIESSSRLQAKLHLHPVWTSHLSLPFDIKQPNNFTTFSCYATLDPTPESDPLIRPPHAITDQPAETTTMRITACFNTTTHPLPTLGPRCASMFICQPPVTEMEAHPDCCSWPYHSIGLAHRPATHPNPPTKRLSRPTGITIGDIRDATREIMQEHRLCPHAGHWSMDEEGFVKPMVYFEAKMEMQGDDRMLVEARQEVKRFNEESARTAARCVRMRAYANAKMNASQNGWPIPTLKEFEMANPQV